MDEIWKDIAGFEGLYQISNSGRVKSFLNSKNGYILSAKHSGGWYLSVRLTDGNVYKSFKIHRLVADAFIPNPENKHEVNHIDGNKQNNMVSNLEWVTSSENMKHAASINRLFLNPMIRKNRYGHFGINQFTESGQFISSYANAVEASKSTGICKRNILQVATKEEYKPGKTRKQAGGYVWEAAPLIFFEQ
jgi:hypothetical protein